MDYKDQKTAEIALNHPQSISVFQKYGIDFCCNGQLTVGEQCLGLNINVDTVASAIEFALSEKEDNSKEKLPEFREMSLTALADYIETKHHKYVRSQTPEILRLLEKVKNRHAELYPELHSLEESFVALSSELQAHMQKEEMILFQYIRQLEKGSLAGSPPFGTVANPVRAMEHEHDQAGMHLKRCRDLTQNYQLPANACASFWQLYHFLEEFEADLHMHIHLENNLLFPKAIQMESAQLTH